MSATSEAWRDGLRPPSRRSKVLLLAALLVGNDFGTWAAVHRSLWNMSTPEHIRAEQTLTRRFKSITPFWMSSVMVSCLPVLALTHNRDPFAFRSTLTAMFCFIGMMVSTLLGNMPINTRTLELSPEETPPEEWKPLRKRWERLHALRVLLNVAAVILLQLGALRGEEQR